MWKKLKISTIREANLLSYLSSVMQKEHYPKHSVDELNQALHVCATGCFKCQGAPMTSALPLSIASRYTSRKVVDDLIDFGPNFEKDLAAGEINQSISVRLQNVLQRFIHTIAIMAIIGITDINSLNRSQSCLMKLENGWREIWICHFQDQFH